MRRSVNKHIAKPLQHVLSGKQRLWQVSLLSTHSEPNNQYKQGAEITDPKTEKSTFDLPLNKHPASESESFGTTEQPINNLNPDIQKDFVRATLYYDREADTIHCCAGYNNVFRSISYHANNSNENEIKDSEDSSSTRAGQTNKDSLNTVGLKNQTESSSNLNEYDNRIKKFTDGVTSKIKQGTYVSDSRFTYKPININDNLTCSSDKALTSSNEGENEYVRAILNGIPCKNKNKPILHSQIEDNIKLSNRSICDSKCPEENPSKVTSSNVSSQTSKDSPVPPANINQANEKETTVIEDERKSYIELCRNNSQLRFQKQFEKSPKAEQMKPSNPYKDIYRDKLNYRNKKFKFTRMDEEFRSPSYSLRNGFEEKDILKIDSISHNRFHSPADSGRSANAKYQPNQIRKDSTELSEAYSHSKPPRSRFITHQEQLNRETHQTERDKVYRTYLKQMAVKHDFSYKTAKGNNIDLEKERKFYKNSDKSYQIAKTKGNSSYDVLRKESFSVRETDLTPKSSSSIQVSSKATNTKEKGNYVQEIKSIQPQSFSDSIPQDNAKKTTTPQPTLPEQDEKNNCFKDINKLEIVPSQNNTNRNTFKEIKSNPNDNFGKSSSKAPEPAGLNKTYLKSDTNNAFSKVQYKNDNIGLNIQNYFNDPPNLSPTKSKNKIFEMVSTSTKLKNKDEQKMDAFESAPLIKPPEKKLDEVTASSKDSLNINSLTNISPSDKVSKDILQETKIPSTIETPSMDASKTLDDLKAFGIQNDQMKDEKSKDAPEKLEVTVAKDEKEKAAEISFPGITPLPFFSAGGLEKSMKEFETKDGSTNRDQTSKKENILSSPPEQSYQPTEKKISNENVALNLNKLAENSNLYARPDKSKTADEGKGASRFNLHNSTSKKEPKTSPSTLTSQSKIDGFKKAVYEKPAKEKLSSFDAAQINNDKIALILKEHRRLLELLLEKVNSRMLSPTHEISKEAVEKRRNENKEGDKTSSKPFIDDNFKKMLNSNIELQERVKRLHPRKNVTNVSGTKLIDPKTDIPKMDISGPTPIVFEGKKCDLRNRDVIPPRETRAKNVSIYKPKPFKRFHVVTMMTSPSGKCHPKKSNDPLIDGSKLAKYNYSPLKQILSQYGVDSTAQFNLSVITPVRKISLSSLPESKNIIFDKPKKKPERRSISYTTYLSIRGKNDRAKIKSKAINSQIKKINMVNKKKNYKLKDNVKKQHIDLKSGSQAEVISTLRKITASDKSTAVQEVKTEESEANKPTEESTLKLSKGVFFDSIKREFHNSTNKYIKPKPQHKKASANYQTGLIKVKMVENPKTRSLNDKKDISFVTRSNLLTNPIFKSSTGLKSNVFNADCSKQIVEGPTWIVSPEYSITPTHWNLSGNLDKSKEEKGNESNSPDKDSVVPSTMNLLASLTKKMMVPKFFSLPSKSSWQKSLKIPILASSAIPISTDLLKYKTYGKKPVQKKVVKKTNTFPKLYQVGKEFENEHLLTLAEPETSSFTTVTNKNKLTKLSRPEYKPKILAIDSKSNLLKSNANNPAYKVYSRNYLRFSPLKFLTPDPSAPSPSKEIPIEKEETPPCKHCKDIQEKSKEYLTLKPIQKSLSKITKISEHYNTKIYINDILSNNINLPSIHSMKISWKKISAKVKNLIKLKLNKDSQCCMPNFDELMMSVSKDIEKNQNATSPLKMKRNDDRNILKRTRSKELYLLSEKNIKSLSYLKKPKVYKIPQFSEEMRNF